MIKKHIPNTITLGNLTCGCLGLVACAKGDLKMASYMIWLAAFLDFLDGFVARMLNVSSPIGKELDSLADMVTFGLLPSYILYSMLNRATTGLWPYVAFILALFSALRLAKFNIDERQSNGFIGMPTPASAFFVSGLVFWPENNVVFHSMEGLLVISLMLAFLLVAPLPVLALKFKDFSIKNNFYRYLVVIVSAVLLVVLGLKSFPIIIMVYLALSLLAALTNKPQQ